MTESAAPSGPSAVVRRGLPPGMLVAIAVTAQFMVVLDGTIVNVALPGMRHSLGLSATGQQWVVNCYLIAFGGLLLLAARAGDLFGRRRLFLLGLATFTVASLAGGLAEGQTLLLIARAVQGVGAAAMAPASLSLITSSHPEGPARTRALALWSMAAASAGALGLVLGGVLTTLLSWRWVLFVNVPVGVALLVAAAVWLLPDRPAVRARLDIAGAVTVTAGFAALVYGISEATTGGWGSAPVVGALAAAAVLLAGFVLIERRAVSPLVPLGIFTQRSLTVGNILMAFGGFTLTGSMFFLSLYCQQILGYSALRTGLAMLPMTLLLLVGALACRRLLPLLGPRRLLLIGIVPATAGLLWLAGIPVQSAYVTTVLLPTLLVGAGFGLMILPLTVLATAGVEPRYAGLASGFLNTGRQLGGAIGLATLVTIASYQTEHSRIHALAAATVYGYRTAFLVCAGATLASAVLMLALPKPAPRGNSASREGDDVEGMTGIEPA